VQQALLKITGRHGASCLAGRPQAIRSRVLQVDTTNILFICGAAFSGLERSSPRATFDPRSASQRKVLAPEDRRTGEIFRHVEPKIC